MKFLKFKMIAFNFLNIENKDFNLLYKRIKINLLNFTNKNSNILKYISLKNSFNRKFTFKPILNSKYIMGGLNYLTLKLFFKINIIKFYKYYINIFFKNPGIKYFFDKIINNEIFVNKNLRLNFLKYEFFGNSYFKSKLFYYLKNSLFLYIYKLFNKNHNFKKISSMNNYFKYKNLILKKYFYYFSFLKFWLFKFFLNKYTSIIETNDIFTNFKIKKCYQELKNDLKNLFLINLNFLKSKFFVYHSSCRKFKNILNSFFPKKYNIFYHLFRNLRGIYKNFFKNEFVEIMGTSLNNKNLELLKFKNKNINFNYPFFFNNLKSLKKNSLFDPNINKNNKNPLSNYKIINHITLQLQKMLFINITIALNNVFFTVLTTAGRVLYKCSAGCYGFRNRKRRQIFAVTQAARLLGLKIKQLQLPAVFLNLNVSSGNKFVKSLFYGFQASKINFTGIIYNYNRPFTACKLKKLRRV
jgi:ribosomal protein S11